MWKLLLSVRALKSGKGWNVIWEVQVVGKPGRTFLSSKKHSFLVDWFRFMMASAEPTQFLWTNSKNAANVKALVIWESEYILLRFDKTSVASTFQDFPNFHTHTFNEYKALDFICIPSLYIWRAGQNGTNYIFKGNFIFAHFKTVQIS